MVQGKIENRPVKENFQKGQSSSVRPWQRRIIVAPFGIAGIKIYPTETSPGETVNISFKAINATDFISIYPITLKINDEVVAAEVVSLLPRTAVPMNFTIARALPGDYQVNINNSSGAFTVTGNALENELASIEGIKPDISSIEASLDSSLWEAETIVKHGELSVKNLTPAPGESQPIDKMAHGIELGLDKMGDGIILLMERLVNLPATIFRCFQRK